MFNDRHRPRHVVERRGHGHECERPARGIQREPATVVTAMEARGREILSAHDPIPKVMGIVNLTPDSFSDGGRAGDPRPRWLDAHRLAAEGADLLDLGGESSRPGAEPVSLAEEAAPGHSGRRGDRELR